MNAAEVVQFYESISEMGPSEAIKAIEEAIATAVQEEREAIEKAAVGAELALRRDASRSSPRNPYLLGAANGLQGIINVIRERGGR